MMKKIPFIAIALISSLFIEAQERSSRWYVGLEGGIPKVSLLTTHNSISTLQPEVEVTSADMRVQAGLGAELAVGYQLTDRLAARLYSRLTQVLGSKIDALPAEQHDCNLLWESGLKLTWYLPARNAKKSRFIEESSPVQAGAPVPISVHPSIATPIHPSETVSAMSGEDDLIDTLSASEHRFEALAEAATADSAAPVSAPAPARETPAIDLPVIYFRFNSTCLLYRELPKLDRLAAQLNEHADVHIVVEGWTDARGSEEVNRRFAQYRADIVKRYLTDKGIDAGRITARDRGVKTDEPDAGQARCAMTYTTEAVNHPHNPQHINHK